MFGIIRVAMIVLSLGKIGMGKGLIRRAGKLVARSLATGSRTSPPAQESNDP